jgi:beta-galactosidase
MLTEGGVNVPLYTTDGESEQRLRFGRFDDHTLFGVNYRATPGMSDCAVEGANRFRINNPFFVGEFWSGRSMHWGEPFYHRNPTETSEAFLEALKLGGHVCFYMFAGGTNFGFMAGADMGKSYSPRPNTPIRYIPHTTSYDVDALINEAGIPTEKYFLCRDVLDEYLGKEKRPHEIVLPERQAFTVNLTESAALFDNIDVLSEMRDYSTIPKSMEEYEQNYGLILYSTTLDAFKYQSTTISLDTYRDRASIYIDNDWFATFTRDRSIPKTADGVEISSGLPVLSTGINTRKIDILVENIGRINFGKDMVYERKGLENTILSSGARLFGYETNTLPLKDLTRLTWKDNESVNHAPYFFKGMFTAKHGVDTFVDFSSFGHGYIWINGFNLGRYWDRGPQTALYLPGALLKEENEIVVFEADGIKGAPVLTLNGKHGLGDHNEEVIVK